MNPLILAAAALVAGLVIGGLIGSRHYRRMCLEFQLVTADVEAALAVSELELLRSGDTAAATKRLEMGLDSALVQLGVLLRPPRRIPADSGYLQTLRKARAYRDKFPCTRSPDIDAAVARALALAPAA